VHLTNGSGSGSCSDPAPVPANFVIDLQDAIKKQFFLSFSALEGTFISFFKDKKYHKEVT